MEILFVLYVWPAAISLILGAFFYKNDQFWQKMSEKGTPGVENPANRATLMIVVCLLPVINLVMVIYFATLLYYYWLDPDIFKR